MTFIKMESYTIQQRVKLLNYFMKIGVQRKMFLENYVFTICIIHLKALSIELFKNLKKLVQWKIRKEKDIVAPVVHKSILIWLVKVLLKTRKYPLIDVHNTWTQWINDKRVDVCGAARGDHLADIVFRI